MVSVAIGQNAVMVVSEKVLRVVRPALLIVGLVAGVVALATATSPPSGDGARSPLLQSDISPVEELIPAEDAQILRQDRVGVDLVPGWYAELTINGVPIPEEEINSTASLGRYFFQAREGRAIEELRADRNCATATMHPFADPETVERVTWCFSAT